MISCGTEKPKQETKKACYPRFRDNTPKMQESVKKELLQKNARCSLLLTNQKLWDMAKTIVDKQKSAKEQSTDNVDWNMLQDLWFDWLEEELFGK